MAVGTEAYARQLKQLLPPGAALQADTGSRLAHLLLAVAEELARIDVRAEALGREWDPRSALELLAEWETALGLPDPCVPGAQILQARRDAVLTKLTEPGGQSRQFFIDLAAALGFAITITEFRPFRAGAAVAGDSLTNGPWVHTWQINAPEETIREFRAGQSAAGEPLRNWGNEPLECVIAARKPAHTVVLFTYG